MHKNQKIIDSVCTYCGVGCEIVALMEDGKIKKVYAKEGGKVSRGKLCIKGKEGWKYLYSDKRIKEARIKKSFFEISMVPEHKPIKYKSGQFVFVRFYNQRLTKESHTFSIASKSNDETLRIVVKKLGDYTSNMEELKVGDKVAVEGPYGRFNYKNYSRDQVWIAGGIGITPFLGMVRDLYDD